MAFIKSQHSSAFDSIVRILKSDPGLSRGVKTWIVPDGSPSSRAADPASGKCPMVRLDPKPGDTQWMDTECLNTPLLIDITATFDGTDVRNGMDFSEALTRALYPTDADRKEQVSGLMHGSISGVYVTKFAFGTVGEGGLFLTATGQIRLEIFLEANDPRNGI